MITGTITAEDYLAAQQLHRQAARKRAFFVLAFLFVAGVSFSMFSDPTVGYVFVGSAVGGFIAESVTSLIYLPWKVRKLHQQQKDFAEPFTYKWDSEYLEARGVSGQSRRRWDAYHKFKEDPKLMLLYRSDNLFEMLPKAWFADASALQDFRKCATAINKPNKTIEPTR